jgi:serralysin
MKRRLLTNNSDKFSFRSSSQDEIRGLGGDDYISLASNTQNVMVSGGTGDDQLVTHGTDNSLYGNDGDDILTAALSSRSAKLSGGRGNDTYNVSAADAIVSEVRGAGYDRIETKLARFVLPENVERLTSGRQLTDTRGQTFIGNNSANDIYDSAGNDRLEGLRGDDEFVSLRGNDLMIGGSGNDGYTVLQSSGQSRRVTIIETGDDPYDAVQTDFAVFVMSEGIDNLIGNYGFGVVVGQSITGNSGENTITDGLLNDSIRSMGGNDIINSKWGNDQLRGGAGSDLYNITRTTNPRSVTISENTGEGTDKVETDLKTFTLATNVEFLTGTASDGQTLTGNASGNTIMAGSGNDLLNGFSGNDRLDGGAGRDTLIGGNGTDQFRFLSVQNTLDVILDFADGDRLAVSGPAFGGLAVGGLDPTRFVTGTRALDSEDRFIFRPSDGLVLFDADGTGVKAAVAFAQIQNNYALTAFDFLVI